MVNWWLCYLLQCKIINPHFTGRYRDVHYYITRNVHNSFYAVVDDKIYVIGGHHDWSFIQSIWTFKTLNVLLRKFLLYWWSSTKFTPFLILVNGYILKKAPETRNRHLSVTYFRTTVLFSGLEYSGLTQDPEQPSIYWKLFKWIMFTYRITWDIIMIWG